MLKVGRSDFLTHKQVLQIIVFSVPRKKKKTREIKYDGGMITGDVKTRLRVIFVDST
jgi:hypothetical protein